nr:RnfABCDGE type electron transport complex subunit D [Anoxynatronum buryatiense]
MGPAPHIRHSHTDREIMKKVVIACLLPTIAAVYLFGFRALLMALAGMISAVLFEALYQKVRGKEITVSDYSAVVTGLLLALALPVTAPLWSLILGTFFAIIIVKQLPGGLGKNPINPAVAARIALKLFFEPHITQWVMPGPDAVATATPIEYIGHFTRTIPVELPPLSDLFLGSMGGGIGEVSKLFILFGCVFLVFNKIIDMRVPLATIAGAGVTAFLYSGMNLEYTAYHLLSGALFLGAVYMVTDYSSGPLTLKAKIFYAFMVGVLTIAIRILFNLPGGFGIALLIMNVVSRLIDKLFTPRVMGHSEREISSDIYNVHLS